MPARGADAWFGSVGGAREPPPQPGEPPQVADLLEQLVTSGGRLVGAADVLIYLVEHDAHGSQQLIVRHGAGCFATSVARSVGKGEGLAGEVWRIGAPLAVGDYQSWPGRLWGARGEDGICGALAVPLHSHGAVVGVLGVASRRPGRVFGQAEIELLCRFGGSRSGHRQRRAACRCPPGAGRAGPVRSALPDGVRGLPHWSTPRSTPSAAPGCTKAGGRRTSLATPEESGQPGFWKTILHPDDRERVLAEDRRVELTGDPWRMEYRSIAKDGRVVWLRVPYWSSWQTRVAVGVGQVVRSAKANVAPWRRGRPPFGERAAGGGST